MKSEKSEDRECKNFIHKLLEMKKIFFNRALRILLTTDGLVRLSNAMMGPIYALFVAKIHGSILDAGLTAGIFALTAGLATLVSGRFADKIRENELIIVLGYSLIAAGYFLYLFVNSISLLFLVQVIIGLGEAVYVPAFDAVYSKHLDSKRFGRQWGAWEAMNYLVYALGAISGGILVEFFGFTVIFLIMMILCLGSAAYLFFLPRSVL